MVSLGTELESAPLGLCDKKIAEGLGPQAMTIVCLKR